VAFVGEVGDHRAAAAGGGEPVAQLERGVGVVAGQRQFAGEQAARLSPDGEPLTVDDDGVVHDAPQSGSRVTMS